MRVFSNRRTMWTVIGTVAAVMIIVTGILVLVTADQSSQTPGAAPTVSNPPTTTLTSPTTSPTTSRTSPMTPTTLPTGPPAARVMTVRIYFNDDASNPSHVVAMERTVPRSPRVATAALRELLGGPTEAERDAGYFSWFGPQTAGMLRSVRVVKGVAYVDFQDFSGIIPNASTSTGSAMLIAQLDTTLKQFPTINSTVYSFNGDIDAFYLWLQLTPPVGHQS